MSRAAVSPQQINTIPPTFLHATGALAGGLIVQCFVRYWRRLVDSEVSEPYLDEYFHVGQAQTYCSGDYRRWDPKITTPPGLYVVSQVWLRLTGEKCDIDALRSTSGPFLCWMIVNCVTTVLSMSDFQRGLKFKSDVESLSRLQSIIHTAVNVALFPPLFFFSALYYTDIASTAFVVLHFCVCDAFKVGRSAGARGVMDSVTRTIILTVTGTIALTFRQTNIFWVAIFPMGMSIVNMGTGFEWAGPVDVLGIITHSFQTGITYDPDVSEATLLDYFRTGVSLLSSTLGVMLNWAFGRQLKSPTTPEDNIIAWRGTQILDIVPFVVLLAEFAAFVLWNGGVVLGDKSNHVATVHLPQMLYIWPYIAFFSWPLLYTIAFGNLLPTRFLPRRFEPYASIAPWFKASTAFAFVSTLAIGLIIVHLNTIVHPFTLADNRHYVFYVFRLLMRHRAVKYLAVPVYMSCGILAIQALGGSGGSSARSNIKGREERTLEQPKGRRDRQQQKIRSGAGTSASYVIVWLATCTLCLVSAPLVEPRYFILPWLCWRLQVASSSPPVVQADHSDDDDNDENDRKKESNSKIPPSRSDVTGVTSPAVAAAAAVFCGHDHRLWLETAWYLAVNAVTGYVFLRKGFGWPQEPGKVQRFMW